MLIWVRIDDVLVAAGQLDGDCYRLAHGLAGVPDLTVSAPGWAAGPALTAVDDATRRWLGGLADRVATVATGLRTAAAEYDAADQRAAHRLTGLR